MTAQPMDPKDVPDELLNAFKTAGYAAMMTPGATGGLSDRYLAGGLAAVVPLIRAQAFADLRRGLQAEHDRVRDLEGAALSDERKIARHQGALAEAIRMIDHIARGDQ